MYAYIFAVRKRFLGEIIFITVISEPQNDIVTICDGDEVAFSCTLNSNAGVVQWYRYTKNTTETVDPSGENTLIVTQTGITMNTLLTITNARKSNTGYYWVGTSFRSVCFVSLNVTTSK